MVRIVEHRSALPNGPILALHVRYDANSEPPVFAHLAVEISGQSAHPDAFPEHMPVDEAFLQALAYAEHAAITVVWIDDPGGHFPPERPFGGIVGEADAPIVEEARKKALQRLSI